MSPKRTIQTPWCQQNIHNQSTMNSTNYINTLQNFIQHISHHFHRTHTRMHTHARTHADTHTLSLKHTYTHTHTHIHARTHTHTHTLLDEKTNVRQLAWRLWNKAIWPASLQPYYYEPLPSGMSCPGASGRRTLFILSVSFEDILLLVSLSLSQEQLIDD